jgi:hypothetical protein
MNYLLIILVLVLTPHHILAFECKLTVSGFSADAPYGLTGRTINGGRGSKSLTEDKNSESSCLSFCRNSFESTIDAWIQQRLGTESAPRFSNGIFEYRCDNIDTNEVYEYHSFVGSSPSVKSVREAGFGNPPEHYPCVVSYNSSGSFKHNFVYYSYTRNSCIQRCNAHLIGGQDWGTPPTNVSCLYNGESIAGQAETDIDDISFDELTLSRKGLFGDAIESEECSLFVAGLNSQAQWVFERGAGVNKNSRTSCLAYCNEQVSTVVSSGVANNDFQRVGLIACLSKKSLIEIDLLGFEYYGNPSSGVNLEHGVAPGGSVAALSGLEMTSWYVPDSTNQSENDGSLDTGGSNSESQECRAYIHHHGGSKSVVVASTSQQDCLNKCNDLRVNEEIDLSTIRDMTCTYAYGTTDAINLDTTSIGFTPVDDGPGDNSTEENTEGESSVKANFIIVDNQNNYFPRFIYNSILYKTAVGAETGNAFPPNNSEYGGESGYVYEGCGVKSVQNFLSWFELNLDQQIVSGRIPQLISVTLDITGISKPLYVKNGLQELLNDNGYSGLYQVNIEELSGSQRIIDELNQGYPVIVQAHQGTHYITIVGVDGDNFIVHDNASLKTMTWEELDISNPVEGSLAAQIVSEAEMTYTKALITVDYIGPEKTFEVDGETLTTGGPIETDNSTDVTGLSSEDLLDELSSLTESQIDDWVANNSDQSSTLSLDEVALLSSEDFQNLLPTLTAEQIKHWKSTNLNSDEATSNDAYTASELEDAGTLTQDQMTAMSVDDIGNLTGPELANFINSFDNYSDLNSYLDSLPEDKYNALTDRVGDMVAGTDGERFVNSINGDKQQIFTPLFEDAGIPGLDSNSTDFLLDAEGTKGLTDALKILGYDGDEIADLLANSENFEDLLNSIEGEFKKYTQTQKGDYATDFEGEIDGILTEGAASLFGATFAAVAGLQQCSAPSTKMAAASAAAYILMELGIHDDFDEGSHETIQQLDSESMDGQMLALSQTRKLYEQHKEAISKKINAATMAGAGFGIAVVLTFTEMFQTHTCYQAPFLYEIPLLPPVVQSGVDLPFINTAQAFSNSSLKALGIVGGAGLSYVLQQQGIWSETFAAMKDPGTRAAVFGSISFLALDVKRKLEDVESFLEDKINQYRTLEDKLGEMASE